MCQKIAFGNISISYETISLNGNNLVKFYYEYKTAEICKPYVWCFGQACPASVCIMPVPFLPWKEGSVPTRPLSMTFWEFYRLKWTKQNDACWSICVWKVFCLRQRHEHKHRHSSANEANNDKHWMEQLQFAHKGIEKSKHPLVSERNQVHSHVCNEGNVSFIVVFQVRDIESKRKTTLKHSIGSFVLKMEIH